VKERRTTECVILTRLDSGRLQYIVQYTARRLVTLYWSCGGKNAD